MDQRRDQRDQGQSAGNDQQALLRAEPPSEVNSHRCRRESTGCEGEDGQNRAINYMMEGRLHRLLRLPEDRVEHGRPLLSVVVSSRLGTQDFQIAPITNPTAAATARVAIG